MSGRTRITPREFEAIQRRRRESAEAAARGRSHRALPLDEVERRARIARKPWPEASASSESGIEGEEPYNQRPIPPAPPAYPWRKLLAGFAMALACVGAAGVIVAYAPPAPVVATR